MSRAGSSTKMMAIEVREAPQSIVQVNRGPVIHRDFIHSRERQISQNDGNFQAYLSESPTKHR